MASGAVAAFTGGEPGRALGEVGRLDRVQADPGLVGERIGHGHPPLLVASTAGRSACRPAGTRRARRASDTASSRASPGSLSRLARPIDLASSPDTPRPVRIRSRAWDWPIRRGSRTVPPSISGTPHRRQYTPNIASWAATRRSHQIASSSPPATANPSTAAMTGFDSSHAGRAHRPIDSVDVPVDPVAPTVDDRRRGPPPNRTCRPRRSAPPPSTSSSASNARNASARAAAVGPSTALRTSGRSIVTTVTGPSLERGDRVGHVDRSLLGPVSPARARRRSPGRSPRRSGRARGRGPGGRCRSRGR